MRMRTSVLTALLFVSVLLPVQASTSMTMALAVDDVHADLKVYGSLAFGSGISPDSGTALSASARDCGLEDAKIVFQDDFDDGNDDGWATDGPGNWSVQSGEYALSSYGTNTLSISWIGSDSWINYAVEFSVRNLSCVDDGLVLRGGQYKINLRHGQEFGAPNIRLWGPDSQWGTYQDLLADEYYLLSSDIWYRIRAEVVDQRIRVLVDGNLVIDYTDTSTPASGGKIALLGWNGQCAPLVAHFDDVVVYGYSPSLHLPFDPAEHSNPPATQSTRTGLYWLTSYFDHEYPTYETAGVLRSFTGVPVAEDVHCDSEWCPCASRGATHCYDGHDGYDFGLVSGRPVRAAADGVAYYEGGNSSPMGHTIVIQHGGNYYSKYGHLQWDGLYVNTPGVTRQIAAGQTLGLVGNSGTNTTGPHLHFMVYHDVDGDGVLELNEKVDPYGYNPALADPWPTAGGGTVSTWLWDFDPPAGFYIGLDGGTAVSADNGLTADVPAGASSTPIHIHLSLGTDPQAGASATLNLRSYSATAVDASGNLVTSFPQPVTLTMPYGDLDVQYAQESSLTIHWWDELNQAWEPLTTVLDAVNRTVSAVTSHFSLFSLRGTPVYPAPGVQEVGPNVLWNDIDRTLTITGTGFVEGAQTSIGQSRLATEFVATTTLHALVADGLLLGTYDVTVTNPDGQSGTVDNAITIVQAASVPLVPGWNLVSIPIQPLSTTITETLSSISGHYDLVYAYDTEDSSGSWRKYSSTAPFWANDLATVNERMGLWIRATDSVTLGLTGAKTLTTTIPLTTGWNLVGYSCLDTRSITAALSSIEGLYTQVYAYDAAHPENPWQSFDMSMPTPAWTLTEMAPGRGYWIKATEPCTLTISSP